MTMSHPSELKLIDRPVWRHVARTCVVISGVFCVFVAAMLGVLWIQQKIHHPLVETVSGNIAVLREQLQNHPADGALKNQIRDADVALRDAYWTRYTRMQRGAWLLLGGVVVLIAGLKTSSALQRRIPQREQILAPDRSAAEMSWALWTISGVGGAMTVLLLAGAWWSVGHPVIAVEPTFVPIVETPVTVDQLLAQWPAFRGFGGAAAHIPNPTVRTWDGTSGQNVLWHSAVTLPGNSSPVIWNDKVVVTGANESQRQVMAYDLASGKPLWQTSVGGAGPTPEITEDTSFAAPSPVTDGFRAYAIFATGDIAAVDLATGRKIWEKNLGKPVSSYGYAASLAIFADAAGTRVIVQWDMGAAEDNKSSLMALDGRSGKLLWQTKRPVGNSWASPLVTKVEGDAIPWQIITAADPWVIGYDAATGAELWRSSALGGDVAPSPAAAVHDAKTYIFAAEEGINRAAIAISNARGETAPAWKLDDEGLPNIVSPVSDGHYVWTVIASGVLYCFDIDGGKKVWEHDFTTAFQATPALVGAGDSRELWLTDATGITHRIAVGADFKELATCPTGETVAASLAFSDTGGVSRFLIRGKKNLYCIGGPATAAGGAK
jgi:outer membrane protein assembly factor BamB